MIEFIALFVVALLMLTASIVIYDGKQHIDRLEKRVIDLEKELEINQARIPVSGERIEPDGVCLGRQR